MKKIIKRFFVDFDFLLIFQISAKSINWFGFYSCFKIYHLKSKNYTIFFSSFFSQNGPKSPKMVNFARTLYIIYENCAKKVKKID